MGERQNARPLLEVVGIAKFYGAVVALRNANLKLHRGEVVALVGDNGAGKSTLIKILSGSVMADSGVIRFDGEPVVIREPSDAVSLGIQTVYQDLALCDNLDIIDNIFLGREARNGFLRGFRLKRPEMERAGKEILDSMGIRFAHIDAPIAALSGGQRQGAAVCRAVLGDPKVVILDEPTAALGVTQTHDVLTLIGRLREQGRGVIVISHNIPDLLRVADRLVVLRLGETIADKPRSEWTEHSLVSAITGAAGAEQFANTAGAGEWALR
ncbi:MAG: sugar ABC transporter ATP-binding protein [Chloroflexota bacterium]|nr:sugar ABC transporter ATP-binding protein [Chloroflexota bacterium]